MNQTLTLARRELRSALDTPAVYVLVAAQSLFAAAWLYFVKEFFASGLADLRNYFAIMPFVLAFTGSALGMRSWAEERRIGTFEMLATLPATPLCLVAGKYLGVLSIMTLSFIPMLGVPFAAGLLGSFDPGIIAANFLGLFLTAMAVLAVSQWASSFTSSQVQSFLVSASVLAGLLLVERLAGYAFPRGFPATLAAWLSMARHFQSFSGGAADTRDIAYFLALTTVFLVPAVRAIGRKR